MRRGLWTRELVGWILAAALLPVAATVLAVDGGPAAIRMGAAFVTAAFWAGLFRAIHGVPLSPTPLVLAVSVALLAPLGLTALQIALGVSFGIVLAELVFGGWGRNIIGAPAVALALLYLSHPGAAPPASETAVALAGWCAALLLLATGVLSMSVLLSGAVGVALVTVSLGLPLSPLPIAGGVVFAAVFLLGDPVAAPTSVPARIVYGAIAGSLAALLAGPTGLMGAGPPLVFAVLLAQVFAPAFDHAALSLNRLARERRRA
ncbi:RnfABCDGE type electron transport complex subunit D [Histidinibacterium aquaticum]|uniref:NADH-quinone reductase n=1 Tax=Histidinibacterium aquaticum TaxID=2613962 RepID=A0A5J5GM90_9RHOB|nr:RnfABCDGE type electron transport complex subunit D [Histidinibacterium aquaticum]KAA9009411.1 hypothetical protein F3S47_09220 [Histidinibacterium aquaticum]